MSAVHADACDTFGNPHRVSAEQLVVFTGSQMSGNTQLQDIVIHEFLDLFFGVGAVRKVSLCVDIDERGGSADGHRRAVFFLDACQIREVGPLDRFLDVFRRSGDVEAVAFCHFLDFLEGADLIADFLRGANVFFVHHVSGSDHFMVFLLFLDQIVDAVERCSSVVTDDSAAAVSVRKSRNEAEMSDLTHFVRVCLKNAVVVRREVVEHIVNFRRQCNAVLLHFFSDHLDAAERANASLKRFVCLQSDDDILARNDVAGAECVHAHDAARVNLQRTACFALRDQKLVHLVTAFLGSLCRSREETAVTVIRMVV